MTTLLSRTNLLRIVNLALFLCGTFLAASGWVLAERLEHGHGRHGGTLLGASRHDWQEWHELAGYVAIGLIAVHLIQHWKWLATVAAGHRTWRLVAGLALGAGIAGLLTLSPVE